MHPEMPSRPSPLFGLIFITAILAITFLFVRPSLVDGLSSAEDLSILYLADANQIPVDSYRHPDVLRRDLSSTIQVIDEGTSASAALEPTALEALDVLIVDQSALTFVDPEDIADAYDASVVVFVLNIPVEQFSELIDEPRITFDNFAANPYPGDFFIYTAWAPSSYGRGQNNLDTSQDFTIFKSVLIGRGVERRDY
jgi:hypothetical protein